MSKLHKELFIEHADGFRWRFYSPDEGLFSIEYQEWEASTYKWETVSKLDSLYLDDADEIVTAIRELAEHGQE